jgi:hypothetical protein
VIVGEARHLQPRTQIEQHALETPHVTVRLYDGPADRILHGIGL